MLVVCCIENSAGALDLADIWFSDTINKHAHTKIHARTHPPTHSPTFAHTHCHATHPRALDGCSMSLSRWEGQHGAAADCTPCMGSTPWAVHHGQYTMGSTPWAVHHGQYTMGSTPWAVHHGQYTMGSTKGSKLFY
jgi:hypothetical protein